MSVIWSGVTEEGAVVPVQVTDEGKVVAVGDGPVGDYLPITGGTLTGDLNVSDGITLNAADGTAEFAGPNITLRADGSAEFAGDLVISSDLISITTVAADGQIVLRRQNDSALIIQDVSANNKTLLNSDGSASFGVYPANTVIGANSLTKFNASAAGNIICRKTDSFYNDNHAFQVQNSSGTVTASITGNGSADFSGDVVIGSRGTQWLIRESNGVAMLIEQTRRGQIEPRMQKVRDLPNELDLIEAALNEIMEKLRMTPPAGWPVWDGQDEVTSDNDNA